MPRMAIAIVLLALAALSGSLSYAGYLVVDVLAEYLGTGHVMAGFLLAILFTRLPSVRDGKLRTVGLLPKRARLPLMVALLAFCLLVFVYRGEWLPTMFVGFAGAFLLIFPRIKNKIVNRAVSSFFKPQQGAPSYPKQHDDNVIDVEFREKKD